MEIALIVPTSVLDDFCSTSKVQMCLAHRVLSDEVYASFYRRVASDPRNIVIMDNSLWELGDAMSFEKLIEACQKVKPTELIIMDKFRDGPGTIKQFNAYTFMAFCAGTGDGPCREEYPWQRNFVVAHGKDREEWLECFDFFNEHHLAHTIGLPKVLDEIWTPGGRIGCVEFLEATGRVRADKAYHCLGIWGDPIEVLILNRHGWIRSLDTALPIHAGLRDVKFHPELGLSRQRTKRPHVYFEIEREEIMKHAAITHNVSLLRRWANGRNGSYK